MKETIKEQELETVLKYALDNKVRCFVKSDNSFKEKKYWDNE